MVRVVAGLCYELTAVRLAGSGLPAVCPSAPPRRKKQAKAPAKGILRKARTPVLETGLDTYSRKVIGPSTCQRDHHTHPRPAASHSALFRAVFPLSIHLNVICTFPPKAFRSEEIFVLIPRP